MSPQTLPSGVIYIKRIGAQPEDSTPPTTGVAIGDSTQIRTMMRANYYLATDTDGNVSFGNAGALLNTIDGSGSPVTDPMFYFVKKALELLPEKTVIITRLMD
ncbi:hypothetical protein [Chryseobacterium indoltheticum]|uniref:hypothetical protein n=1 Tax=Chryseobacterium indoltheticum TaxID=254 RepID=UPI003F4919D5